MLTILHAITSLQGGGAERQLYMLASEQRRVGNRVHVAARLGGRYLQPLVDAGVDVHILGNLRGPHPRLLARLARLIRRIEPTVVHSWLMQMDIAVGIVSRAMRVPWVMSERSTAVGHRETPVQATVRRGIGALADVIVANSSAGAADWHRANTVVISNAVDIDAVRAAPAAVAGSLAGPTILHVARLVHSKRPRMLIDALVQVDEVTAVMLGDGPLEPDLRQLVVCRRVEHRIEIHPYRENWWGLLKTSAALVSVSDFEGAPNVVIEAMAGSCPLIVSDIPAHRDLLDESCALFVPPNNADALAIAIRTVIGKHAEAAARAREAAKRVEKRGIATISDAYLSVYRQLGTLG